MIQFIRRKEGESKPQILDSYKPRTWVLCEDPSNDDLALLTTDLKLDEGLVADALDADEVPRFETEDGIIYIFTRFAYKNSSGKIVTAPLAIAIADTYLVTISSINCAQLKKFALGTIDNFTANKSRLLLEILEVLLGTYTLQLNHINRQIRSARASLNIQRVNNKDFVQFVEIEDVLNEFLGDLIPANNVLLSLTGRRKNLTFPEEEQDLIEDLRLSTAQLIDTIRGSLKTAVNIREAYTNIATNNLNRQVKILTTLTVVLTIPTIVGSFFGMNVDVPFDHSAFAFAIIIAGSFGFAGIILLIFRRNGWL